ncbi:LysR family transcriptional regulator [Candidatus Paracaedibacter symbiosus]|uniref:LysR family transcriptional regulator n=1 Tax=Candidatus Paracaedibacter symbiosus TaxID=244582 RepID=UPI00050966CB|nr:LysR family transcriptional regulator [Candidatus Paracaedibacter symbiosus]
MYASSPDFPHWNKLRIFYYVAYFKSFTKAGRHLMVYQSAVSRSIRDLEKTLDDQLFFRDGREISLTPKGEEIFSVVEKVFREIAPLQFLLQQSNEDIDGHLKVVSISNFISMYLSSQLCYFMKGFPKLKIILEEANNGIDLALSGENILIHPYIENRPDLVHHYITRLEYKLYASPEYLSRYSKPETVEDLDNHSLIEVEDYGNILVDTNWHLKIGTTLENGREASLQINSLLGGLKLAEEGVGIISAPSDYTGFKTRNLRQVLPDVPGPVMKIYYIFPEELKEVKSVRAFGDYLKKIFKEQDIF